MIDGKLYRGASGNAGEFGPVTADPHGPVCVCNRVGCLQAVAGVDRIVELALRDKALIADHRLRGTRRSIRRDFTNIARAAVAGDQRALALIKQSADHLAAAVVSLHNVLDLDQILLAGPGFSIVGPIYADTVADHLTRGSWARRRQPVRVALSTMGNDVAALGAASLVLHNEVTSNAMGRDAS